ncbi:TIGR01777 family oxidoreductase [soil metagenome]
MRVLITGATGLVGSHITSLFKEKDIEINYLTTSRNKIEKLPGYQGFYWDPEKGEIEESALTGVNAIIHLAGANIAERWTESYKKEIIDSRVKSAQLLYQTLENKNHQVTHFISASGIGVYRDSLEKLHTEDDYEKDNTFVAEVVDQWEAAAQKFSGAGLKVSVVRLGVILAKEGGALPKLMEPTAFNAGAPLGSGKQWQSWIHIQDVAQIFHFILENGLEGVYNAVAPNPVSNKELVQHIAEKMDRSVWLPRIPAVALKIVLGEMAAVVLTSQLVSSEKIQDAGYRFTYKNLAKALDDLI